MVYIIIVALIGMVALGRFAWRRNRVLGAIIYVLLILAIAWLGFTLMVFEKAGWNGR
jgi:hypothetical protein